MKKKLKLENLSVKSLITSDVRGGHHYNVTENYELCVSYQERCPTQGNETACITEAGACLIPD